MTREEQIAEKRKLIADIKKQISILEKQHKRRLARRKPTENKFIPFRRILKDIETIMLIRALAVQAYCIQSQPIDTNFGKSVIEATHGEPIIIPHVPTEQRHNPDRY